jgi:hypothetical protein
MMKKATIVIGLVLVVLAIFLLKPNLLGSGGETPTLAVVTSGDTMTIPTDISCTDVKDCVDYVLSKDPSAQDVRAVCDKTCSFITEKMPVEVTP